MTLDLKSSLLEKDYKDDAKRLTDVWDGVRDRRFRTKELETIYEEEGRHLAKFFDLEKIPRGSFHTTDEICRKVLLRVLSVANNPVVLDVGCGARPETSLFVASHGYHVLGLEISPTKANLANRFAKKSRLYNKFKATVGKAEKLPFEAGSFDVVFCIDTLEHVPDYATALNEMRRVVKDGGWVLLSVPNLSRVDVRIRRTGNFLLGKSVKESDFFMAHSHIREWTFSGLVADINKAGFRLAKSYFTGYPSWTADYIIQRWGVRFPAFLLRGIVSFGNFILKIPFFRKFDCHLVFLCQKS